VLVALDKRYQDVGEFAKKEIAPKICVSKEPLLQIQ
jgi:hypothetical protein